MRRRQVLKATGAATIGLTAVGTASADPDREKYRPGGPRLGSPQPINLNAFHTNEELTKVGSLESFETFADYGVDTYFDTPLYGESVQLR